MGIYGSDGATMEDGMVLIETLDRPQFLITERSRKRLTHVAFCFAVNPFAYWPVKANIVKGFLDINRKFNPVLKSRERIFLSRQEFEGLLRPDPACQAAFEMELRGLTNLIRKKIAADRATKKSGKKKIE